jgi:hypothetical protein
MRLYFSIICIWLNIKCSEELNNSTIDHESFAVDESSVNVEGQTDKICNCNQINPLNSKVSQENLSSEKEREKNAADGLATNGNLQESSTSSKQHTSSTSNVLNNFEKNSFQLCEKPQKPIAVVRPFRITTVEQDLTHELSQSPAQERQVSPSNSRNDFSNTSNQSRLQLGSATRNDGRPKKKGKMCKRLGNAAFNVANILFG